MNKTISLIIPCYNASAYLSSTLEILASFHFSFSWEFLFLNDGSTDKTKELLEEFQLSHPDLNILVIHNQNHGVAYTRNLGIEKAKGEWIAFLDSDDQISFDGFEAMLNLGIKHKLDVIWGSYASFSHDFPLSTHLKKTTISFYDALEIAEKSWKHNCFSLPLWAGIYRKEFLLKNLISFDSRMTFGEDQYFVFKVLNAIPMCAFFERTIYFYRVGHSSLSYQNVKKRIESLFLIQDNLLSIESKHAKMFSKYLVSIWFINNAFSLPLAHWSARLAKEVQKTSFWVFFGHMRKATNPFGLIKGLLKYFLTLGKALYFVKNNP